MRYYSASVTSSQSRSHGSSWSMYVGNLERDTTESELFAFFCVLYSHLFRDSRSANEKKEFPILLVRKEETSSYAFVEVYDMRHAANFLSLTGTMFKHRNVTIELAHTQSKPTISATSWDVPLGRRFIEAWGRTFGTITIGPENFGLSTQLYKDNVQTGSSLVNGRVISIGGIADTMSSSILKQGLRKLCSKWGAVKDIQIPESGPWVGYVYLEFEEPHSAQRASIELGKERIGEAVLDNVVVLPGFYSAREAVQ